MMNHWEGTMEGEDHQMHMQIASNCYASSIVLMASVTLTAFQSMGHLCRLRMSKWVTTLKRLTAMMKYNMYMGVFV